MCGGDRTWNQLPQELWTIPALHVFLSQCQAGFSDWPSLTNREQCGHVRRHNAAGTNHFAAHAALLGGEGERGRPTCERGWPRRSVRDWKLLRCCGWAQTLNRIGLPEGQAGMLLGLQWGNRSDSEGELGLDPRTPDCKPSATAALQAPRHPGGNRRPQDSE